MSRIGDIVNKKASPRRIPTCPQLAGNVCFGVEVELEECSIHSSEVAAKWWSVKEDNSLRSHTGSSMELVFVEPLGGADAVAAVGELVGLLKELKPTCSDRCGTHVHVDVRGMEQQHYRMFVAAAMFVEPLLLAMFASARSENAFCLPAYKCVVPNKYRGVNLATTTTYGSVEFRMFPSTRGGEELIAVMRCLESLYAESESIDEDTLMDEALALRLLGLSSVPPNARYHLASSAIAATLWLQEGHYRERAPAQLTTNPTPRRGISLEEALQAQSVLRNIAARENN